ncbi:MAG: hypothetical protein KKF30_12040 [Proteobacteria bacterium]|nr:hypothetical protein [Pseudomonadota bacterium]MBU4469411.1 hypothetical protein [Pseudomonadota bacterium]MCG2752311.1 hypothetical protein [Desulfobacteraceae bacterium]
MKSFHRGNTLFLTTWVLLGCLAFFSQGCSTLSKVTHRFTSLGTKGSLQDLKKKVGVMPLVNMTEYKEALDLGPLESCINERLVSSCTGIIITAREKAGASFLADPPKKASGTMDTMAMALIAREEGFNLILRPILTKVHHEKPTSWWNWLIKDEDLITMTIRMEIYDTHTGAEIFHDNFMEEQDITKVETKELPVPQIMALPDFEVMSSKLAKTMANKISNNIDAFPWKGFLVASDGKTGFLSCGSSLGLKKGQELSLSKDLEVLTGYDGNQYILPGPVVDTVKVVELGPNQAKVVSTSENTLVKGDVVQALASPK